jgi:hypothetical protein
MVNSEQSMTTTGVSEQPVNVLHSLADTLTGAWRAGRKALRGPAAEGMYEVLEYESTLELRDKRGERALVHKHEKVRYLQDNIIAYQDEAWGDGEILLNYRCSPGIPVDWYRPSKKTYILISLREVKNKGDLDEFHMTWEMLHGFLRPTELWEAAINHRMRKFKIQVIFPQSRPPLRASLTEETTRKSRPLGNEVQVQLPDGRWLIFWETDRPRLHETYGLQWEW